MTRLMNIGEAAQAAGVSAKMVRHYESLGLIPRVERTEAGYRQYGAREVSVLRFIRQARQMGFSMKQIAELLTLWTDDRRESRAVKAIAEGHIAELDRRMREIAQMKQALEHLAAGCHGDERPDCPILEELADEDAAPVAVPVSMPVAMPVPASASAKPRGARSRMRGHHEPPLDPSGLAGWMQRLYAGSADRHA